MYLLLIFGIGMVGFGGVMVAKPLRFSSGIEQFSKWPWFHVFETISRAIFGILFLLVAGSTPYPAFVTFLGGILCFVSVFLIIIGPIRHKRIAVLASTIGENFRALGLVAILCGAGLIYLVLAQNA
jgi:hypothetical protein